MSLDKAFGGGGGGGGGGKRKPEAISISAVLTSRTLTIERGERGETTQRRLEAGSPSWEHPGTQAFEKLRLSITHTSTSAVGPEAPLRPAAPRIHDFSWSPASKRCRSTATCRTGQFTPETSEHDHPP